jgi:dTDP-4-amino-4,6-dideoxygalactose transaminase
VSPAYSFWFSHHYPRPVLEEFEKVAAALTGTSYAIGVSSGTDAILLALMALNVGPGDEVLCPSFTFFATAGCVALYRGEAGVCGSRKPSPLPLPLLLVRFQP